MLKRAPLPCSSTKLELRLRRSSVRRWWSKSFCNNLFHCARGQTIPSIILFGWNGITTHTQRTQLDLELNKKKVYILYLKVYILDLLKDKNSNNCCLLPGFFFAFLLKVATFAVFVEKREENVKIGAGNCLNVFCCKVSIRCSVLILERMREKKR